MSRSRNRDRNNVKDYGILNSGNNSHITTERKTESKSLRINDFIVGSSISRELPNPSVINENKEASANTSTTTTDSPSIIVRTVPKSVSSDRQFNINKEETATTEEKSPTRNSITISSHSSLGNVHNQVNNATDNTSTNSNNVPQKNEKKVVVTDNVKDDKQQSAVVKEKHKIKKGKDEKQLIAYKVYCYLNGGKQMPERKFSDKEIAKILKEYSLSRFGRIIPHEVLVESIKTS